MNKLDVRIVTLEPMRWAGASGFGPEPEGIAWDTLLKWAEPIGLLSRPHRFFGYNNPSPAPGSPNYGYDQWITVDETVQPAEPIKLPEFPGGLYAVTRCVGVPNIPEVWKQLVVWCEDSRYRLAHHQWLEECLTPPTTDLNQVELDLYLPIAE